jgi:hypothetical protein
MDKTKRAEVENGELEFFKRKSDEFKFRQNHWEKKHKPTECPVEIKKAIKKQLGF